MTLVISTITSSGIVLTADSRQTYRNNAGAIRIGSDSVMKLFKLADFSGVAISGKAFLNEENQPVKNVGYFINKFKKVGSEIDIAIITPERGFTWLKKKKLRAEEADLALEEE